MTGSGLICAVMAILTLAALAISGVLFIGLATALDPEDECAFCDDWGKTYTDENGNEKSVCDKCVRKELKKVN